MFLVSIPLNRVGVSMDRIDDTYTPSYVSIPLNRVGVSIPARWDKEKLVELRLNPLKSGRCFNKKIKGDKNGNYVSQSP